MIFKSDDHTFVICAYKESKYLEECIESLLNQTIKSNIILTTSTPNSHIKALINKYQLQMFINAGEKGIAGDWNFGISCANTKLVTIAHQDDIYEEKYTERMLKCVNKAKSPIIFSSAYGEIRNGIKVFSNKLLTIKKILIIPQRLFPNSVRARRLSLAFGDSISCPTVTYCKEYIDKCPFDVGMKAALDWQQWEKMSKFEGSFVYCAEPLMCHRIHEESETSKIIGDHSRKDENYEMFRQFWPAPIAKALNLLYTKSEKSNRV